MSSDWRVRSVDTDPADGTLVVAPWKVGSALTLVVVAGVLALLAGAVVAQLGSAAWNPIVQTWAAGGVFLALYAALLGIVWGRAATVDVRFSDSVGLSRAVSPKWYAAALGAALLGWAFSAAFISVLSALGVKLPSDDLAVFRLLPSGPLGVAVIVVLLIVVAPVAEEVVYRGVLLPSLDERWGRLVGLVVSAAVFSAAHLSLAGFVPLFVAGGAVRLAVRPVAVAARGDRSRMRPTTRSAWSLFSSRRARASCERWRSASDPASRPL